MLVSDRAKGLVKLGTPDYLDVVSMPDLFHFNQQLAQSIGALIGKAWKKSYEAYQKTEGYYSQRKPLEDEWLSLDNCRRYYQNGIHGIHKAIQPYTEEGLFTTSKTIRQAIVASVSIIEKQAKRINKEVNEKVISKVFDQIPSIVKGIESWQEWTEQRGALFVEKLNIGKNEDELKNWLLHDLLPVYIWELNLRRVPSKKKNKRLKKVYKGLLEKARNKLDQSDLINILAEGVYRQCLDWAEQTANTFQRSSSKVEGRNGYLSFVHKANRGMPAQRLEVLTVVHNYDIRGWDNKTPAQRLFRQDFPDLFEYIFQNVTGFSEPRKRKSNSLIINAVQP